MVLSTFEEIPSWIRGPIGLQNVTELHYPDTSQIEQFIDVADASLCQQAIKQFCYWRDELSSQVSDKTAIFCFLGKAGMAKVNILSVCVYLKSICDMSCLVETFSASNTHFMGLSFTNSEEAVKVRQSFHYFQDSKVLHVTPPSPDIIHFRLLWLPPLFQSSHVIALLSKYSTSYKYENETTKTGPDVYTRTNVVRGSFILKKGLSISDIPHFVRLPAPHKGFALIVISSRPPLCLRCRETGHVRSLCTAIKCGDCRSFHLQSTACGTVSYSNKLKGYDKSAPSQDWWEGVSDIDSTSVEDLQSNSVSVAAPDAIVSSKIISANKVGVPSSLGVALRSEVIDYQRHSTSTPSDSNVETLLACDSIPHLGVPLPASATDVTCSSVNNPGFPSHPGDTPSVINFTSVMDHSHIMVRESPSADSSDEVISHKKKKILHKDVEAKDLPPLSFPLFALGTGDEACSVKEDPSQKEPSLFMSDSDSIDGDDSELPDEALLSKLGCTASEFQRLRSAFPHSGLTPVVMKKISILKEHGFTPGDISVKPAVLRFSMKSLAEKLKLLSATYATSFTVADLCRPVFFFESLRQGRQVRRN